MKRIILLSVVLFVLGCEDKSPSSLFLDISGEQSGILFENKLAFDEEFNIFTYRNFYNGGGVGLGDINNDGLIDVYLTSNQHENKLFLNKGNLKFEDITEIAGVAGTKAWSTGVSIIDINGDGHLDIYVCNSGDIKGDNKQNELFINNGDLTFTEKAATYNLADKGFSTHAAFLDYDKDGDLDLYLLNNSYSAIGSFNLMKNIRPIRDPEGGDKFFRNDGNYFTDVSEEAGIYGSIIGFGLGITIGDVNNDNWQDIFISNDFFERDYLYINNQDGTFTESLEENMRSISAASMGADMADINNDLLPDIFVTDMLPEPLERIKQVTTFESWDKFKFKKDNGYYNQYSRNMLHINNGNGSFSELGRLAGVEATDWSWGALIFDMDNDGLKDLFIGNGIYQDITDLDYLNFISNDETKKKIVSGGSVDYKALTDPIPIRPVPNYAYQNKGDLVFENKADKWGLGKPGHSNGSAYGDLDNDGDLDLIINNVNASVNVFINQTDKLFPENGFVKVSLKGISSEIVGAKVFVTTSEQTMYQELIPSRGFQSTVDSRLNFGVGNAKVIEEIKVVWPSGKMEVRKSIPANSILIFEESEATTQFQSVIPSSVSNTLLVKDSTYFKGYQHKENYFLDFNRDRLLYHLRSSEGPAFATADINKDGIAEVFIGGSKGYSGQIYTLKGKEYVLMQEFEEDKNSEDMDAVFGDFDGDGDIDLLVASGGNEYGFGDSAFKNRLYLNDGKGNFEKSVVSGFDSERKSTSVVEAVDFDKDGDLDLFFGERLRPFLFGVPCDGGIWFNDGSGEFTERTDEIAPELKEIGLITDAKWADIDNDEDIDLVIVGEWMEISVFINDGKKLSRKKINSLSGKSGWWNAIEATDLDQDGDIDFVVGNHGLNTRFKASKQDPFYLFVNDFDQNGSAEHIYVRKKDTTFYPVTLKHELVAQMPGLKKKFLKYESYNNKALNQIFSDEQIEKSIKSELNYLESVILINDGQGNFELQTLPRATQVSPVYAIHVRDINKDGNLDILLGGNLSGVKPEMGQYDASYGHVLLGTGNNQFKNVSAAESGFSLKGDVRHITTLQAGDNNPFILVLKNNDFSETYVFKD